MARAVGAKTTTVMTQEVEFGVLNPAVEPTTIGMYLRTNALGSSKNLFQSDTLNPYRTVVGLADGNKSVQGNIVTDFIPEGLEVLLHHLLGNGTIVTSGSDPYTHVLKGSANTLEGLSIQKGFDNINKYFLYKGCRMNSMAIDIIQEGFHGVTWDFIGKSETVHATEQIDSSFAVYPTKNGYTGYQCHIETDHTGSWTTLGNVVSGSINIANNVETDGYVLGSDERASAEYQTRACTGGFSMFFEDTVLYDLYLAGTESGLRYVFTNGTDSITFEFPIVKLAGESPNIDSPAGVNLNFTFQARYDSGSETDVTVTIVNSLSSIEGQPS